MPTEPTTPRRTARDDAYTVDTRRRPKRSGGGAIAPSRPAERDADVVDTRGRGGARGSSGGPVEPQEPRYRWRRGRIILITLLVLLLAWIGFMVWVPMQAWGSVNKVDNIPDGARPTDTSGYNYLLVGSDSREGLTAAQRKKYATGNAVGNRTDTIMLVHVSESGGKPVMVSLPRDSYVPIPGHGRDKINAAYSIGGPKLLTETVEQATGIHVDGYVEIGLGGFAAVVDSVGGVDLCVPRDMNDKKAGINLKKGCQTLDGGNALGYVRSRYTDPLGDIGRAARQRQFLGALMKKAATPATVLIPWRYKSFADASAAGLAVGSQTSMMDAVRVLQAMRSVSNDQGLSLSVPTSDLSYRTSAGALAVKWDTERAKALFTALKNDEPLTEAPPGSTVPGAKNS
ncbi:LCP family protein [Terrabacter aerolatus]|uniref:LytTR family transcriptional regulator n=1 Tax=Terrabacter aerolatus TaxID=422442 RepID=A0A512D3I6_9MICO|nr:LCP family protein [Terrabacter aerolatus]GEO31027.1 LytTR family transcriptional regulator [Terrabacter aerolatus]